MRLPGKGERALQMRERGVELRIIMQELGIERINSCTRLICQARKARSLKANKPYRQLSKRAIKEQRDWLAICAAHKPYIILNIPGSPVHEKVRP